MKFVDTSLGGAERRFPETTSGILDLLRDPAPEKRRALFELLSRRYWKPIYAYVRIAWAKSNEDAKDRTQAFFLWLWEEAVLDRFDSERGGLRAYLKVLLRRFVGHQETALARLKRGGGHRSLSLEGAVPHIRELESDPAQADPEKIFERIWLVEIVHQAIDRVRERHEKAGHPRAFQIYEAYDLEQRSERPTYEDLALRFGLPPSEVKTHLCALREEIRSEIRAELSRITVNDQELEDEWKRLFEGS
jgi:RNA polymerase sigma-70 factor (ECF subfamily)